MRETKPLTNRNDESDEYAHGFAHPVAMDLVRQLSVLSPIRALAHIGLEWTLLIGAIYLCQRFWHPGLYVVTVMWIGARQHAIAVLMHDGTHYRIVRNKMLNDVLGELVLAWPLFLSMRRYRKFHFAHHRRPNSDDDPDWIIKSVVAVSVRESFGRF